MQEDDKLLSYQMLSNCFSNVGGVVIIMKQIAMHKNIETHLYDEDELNNHFRNTIVNAVIQTIERAIIFILVFHVKVSSSSCR